MIHTHLRDKSAFEFAQCTEIARCFTNEMLDFLKTKKQGCYVEDGPQKKIRTLN